MKNEYKDRIAISNPNLTIKMTPDFIVRRFNDPNKDLIILESKYKQIPGSDWEKIESNWGFHKYYYAILCNINTIRIIVILTGFWRECFKQYDVYMQYAKEKYGDSAIFDFGVLDDIYRFAKYMNVNLTEERKEQIKQFLIENNKSQE